MELRFQSNFPFLFLYRHCRIKQESLGRKVKETLSIAMAHIYMIYVLWNTPLYKILFSASQYSVHFISESLTLNKLSERSGHVLWTSLRLMTLGWGSFMSILGKRKYIFSLGTFMKSFLPVFITIYFQKILWSCAMGFHHTLAPMLAFFSWILMISYSSVREFGFQTNSVALFIFRQNSINFMIMKRAKAHKEDLFDITFQIKSL